MYLGQEIYRRIVTGSFRFSSNLMDCFYLKKLRSGTLRNIGRILIQMPTSNWAFLQSIGEPSVVKCVSVGWLIHDGEVMVVAPNMGNIEDESSAQASGVIHIPARCVTHTTKLQEPCLTSSSPGL